MGMGVASPSRTIRLCSHSKHNNKIVELFQTQEVLILVWSLDCKLIRECVLLIRNLSGKYRTIPMFFY